MAVASAVTLADHPRSRGVYAITRACTYACTGSSPLARGLLPGDQSELASVRIIPARAGFTPSSTSTNPGAPDHPRSRGVYDGIDGPNTWRTGSSPLARGLRGRPQAREPVGGIIPARAGFTCWSRWPRSFSEDHPRSRGVYSISPCLIAILAGSSPLARGLHVGPVPADERPGIIPARAGFTASPWPPPPSRTDHPRSRGVYRS